MGVVLQRSTYSRLNSPLMRNEYFLKVNVAIRNAVGLFPVRTGHELSLDFSDLKVKRNQNVSQNCS